IEAVNRGPELAPLHLLPQLWFRNIWGWDWEAWNGQAMPEPVIRPGPSGPDFVSLYADDTDLVVPSSIAYPYPLGRPVLFPSTGADMLFTDTETNGPRVFGPGSVSRKPHVKDAFHRHVIHGEACTNPEQRGTKAALHYRFEAVPPGGSAVVRLRLAPANGAAPLAEVDEMIQRRRAEADEHYAALHPAYASGDERLIQR